MEERNKKLLDSYYETYLHETNVKLHKTLPNVNNKEENIKLVFVNGRYHGLMPSIGPEYYYDGHPGIFYQGIINALGTGALNFLIIMSAKCEGYDSCYPIEPSLKKRFIEKWIEILKEKLPDNIIQKLETSGEIQPGEISRFREFLKEKIDGIKIKVRPMGGDNPSLFNIFNEEIREFGDNRSQTLMVTGLEKNEKTDKWYNKYEKTFSGIKFILLGREGGISGTEIRDSVNKDNYMTIARWLINAGMGDDPEVPMLVGEIIHSINQSEETDINEEQMRVYEHIGLTEAEQRIAESIDQATTSLNRENKRKISEINNEDESGKRKITSSYPGKAPRGGTKTNKTKTKTKTNKTKTNKTKTNKTKTKTKTNKTKTKTNKTKTNKTKKIKNKNKTKTNKIKKKNKNKSKTNKIKKKNNKIKIKK